MARRLIARALCLDGETTVANRCCRSVERLLRQLNGRCTHGSVLPVEVALSCHFGCTGCGCLRREGVPRLRWPRTTRQSDSGADLDAPLIDRAEADECDMLAPVWVSAPTVFATMRPRSAILAFRRTQRVNETGCATTMHLDVMFGAEVAVTSERHVQRRRRGRWPEPRSPCGR